MGLRLADYAVNEVGFGADLGFEKYMDLVVPVTGIAPALCVIVSTVQSVRLQGEGDLQAGLKNLEKHIGIVRGFQLPAVVAINRFPKDTDEELDVLKQFCESHGAAFALSEGFAKGGEGARALAKKVVEVIESQPAAQPITMYKSESSALEKIEAVTRSVYGGDGVELSDSAAESLKQFERWGFGHLPVVHRQDAVLALGRPQADGRADRMEAARERGVALGGRRVPGGHFGRDDADAGAAEDLAGAGD